LKFALTDFGVDCQISDSGTLACAEQRSKEKDQPGRNAEAS
jgi:hypothetical protein